MQRLVGLLTVVVLAAFAVAGGPHLVAHAAPSLPGVGTPVIFPLSEGDGEVTVTITQVVDPFGALGGGTPPAGTRYVYVGLTVANGGVGPLDVDPDAVFLVDEDGFVYRPSDLFGGGGAMQTVAPGASVAGGVVFAVPTDAVLTAVYHDPAEDRLILLALLGDAVSVASSTETPVVGGTETPIARRTGTAVAGGDVDCEAFAPYLAEINGRIEQLQAIGLQATDLVGLAQSDPFEAAAAVQGWADDTAALAQEQAQAEVPAGLGDLNDRAVKGLQTYAEAFGQLAIGLSCLDEKALQAFQTILTDGDAQMTKVIDDLNAIADACGLDRIAG
jgi:ABC-type Co2+ transport system permease subunit